MPARCTSQVCQARCASEMACPSATPPHEEAQESSPDKGTGKTLARLGQDLILTGALWHPPAHTFVSRNASRALTAAPVTSKMNGRRC